MNTTHTLDMDVDGIQSLGQAVAPVVERAGQLMAERQTTPTDPLQMAYALIQSGADTASVKEMLAMSREIAAERAKSEFNEAMASAKAEIPTIKKNRVVDFTSSKGRTNYRHEDLAEVARTVSPILSKYGLSYRFRTSSAIGEPISVTCIVSHRRGYSEENTLVGPRDDSGNKNSLQQVGSTLTYLQRMTLKAALGLAASDDDDGKAGGDTAADMPIGDEQILAIRKAIVDTQTDEASFLKWLDVESISHIMASAMPRIMQSFDAKRRRMAS